MLLRSKFQFEHCALYNGIGLSDPRPLTTTFKSQKEREFDKIAFFGHNTFLRSLFYRTHLDEIHLTNTIQTVNYSKLEYL